MKRDDYLGCLLLSLLAVPYSFAGVMMAVWVSAVRGNSPEYVRRNFVFWVSAFVLSLLVTTLCAVALWKKGGSE